MSKRQILVTSALPYANGAIHLGHMVEHIQTDVWVRFQKMRGHECHYVCADDTHGTPVMLRAEKEGLTPEQLINRVHGEHSRDFRDFGVAFDNYHSTHSPENRWYAEDIYTRLRDGAKLIDTRSIEQFYDPVKEMFLPDRFIKGECPKCGAADQYAVDIFHRHDRCGIGGFYAAAVEHFDAFIDFILDDLVHFRDLLGGRSHAAADCPGRFVGNRIHAERQSFQNLQLRGDGLEGLAGAALLGGFADAIDWEQSGVEADAHLLSRLLVAGSE